MKIDAPLDPALMPLCDGQVSPAPDDPPARAEMKREFIAVYHQINLLARKLSAVRAASPSAGRTAAEREVLQAIEKALLARDALEDRHAPTGIVARPVFEHGVVTDLHFTTPGQRYGAPSSTSLCFAVTPTEPLLVQPET